MNEGLRQWHIECSKHNKRMREDEEYRKYYTELCDNMPDYEANYDELMITNDNNREGYFFSILEEETDYFEKLVKIIEHEYNKKHAKGGRKPKLTIADMLIATIKNLHNNIPYFNIANEYGVHESNMFETIKWVEKTLLDYDIIFRIKGHENTKDFYVIDIDKLNSINI